MEKNKHHKNFYEVLSMDREKDILIVDPFVINIPDLQLNSVRNIVRVRRPFWGQGNLSEFINKIEPVEFKKLLEKLIEEEDRNANSRTPILANP